MNDHRHNILCAESDLARVLYEIDKELIAKRLEWKDLGPWVRDTYIKDAKNIIERLEALPKGAE